MRRKKRKSDITLTWYVYLLYLVYLYYMYITWYSTTY